MGKHAKNVSSVGELEDLYDEIELDELSVSSEDNEIEIKIENYIEDPALLDLIRECSNDSMDEIKPESIESDRETDDLTETLTKIRKKINKLQFKIGFDNKYYALSERMAYKTFNYSYSAFRGLSSKDESEHHRTTVGNTHLPKKCILKMIALIHRLHDDLKGEQDIDELFQLANDYKAAFVCKFNTRVGATLNGKINESFDRQSEYKAVRFNKNIIIKAINDGVISVDKNKKIFSSQAVFFRTKEKPKNNNKYGLRNRKSASNI